MSTKQQRNRQRNYWGSPREVFRCEVLNIPLPVDDFAQKYFKVQIDTPPEFAQVIDDSFWDLIT